MTRMRRIGGAVLLAGLIASGLGSATLEAKKPPSGGSQEAICAYLKKIIEYPNTSPWVLAWALSMYQKFGCAG